MKTLLFAALLGTLALLTACSEPTVEPSEEVKNGPKLTKEEAEKYKGIIPGSKKSQEAQQGR